MASPASAVDTAAMAPAPVADFGAMALMAPGPLLVLSRDGLRVEVAPQAGGRIAQITRNRRPQLVGPGRAGAAMIGWGCYPMLPWAGRIRGGAFDFDGRHHQLPLNLAPHAIHGVGFAMPWQVDAYDDHAIELALDLPRDARWPFGGHARHRMSLDDAGGLLLELTLQAGPDAMPATIGWHPWFRKPGRLGFSPRAMYPRDQDGIATRPLVAPTPAPWDDCFVDCGEVVLEDTSQRLTLDSDCSHWVVYDHRAEATCVEPQSGPPDAFNLEPSVLAPGETLRRWFRMQWQGA